MFWIASVVLLAIPFLVYYLLKRDHGYWSQRGVPFSTPILLFGNLWPAMTYKASMGQIYANIYREFQDHAYCGVYNFREPGLLISDIDLIKDVLVRNFTSFHDNWIELDEKVDPILSRNPFFSRGEKWKVIRNQISPEFTPVKIKRTFPLIEEVCRNLVTYIQSEIEEGSQVRDGFEAKKLSSRFAVSAVASCAFGLNAEALESSDSEFFKMTQTLMDPDSSNYVLYVLSLIFPAIKKIKSMKFMNAESEKWLYNVVSSTLAHRKENNLVREDFLNAIKESRELDVTVAHAFTFIVDGFETSSTVLQYALYELAENLDVQVKLRREIDDVTTKFDGRITYDSIQEMTYLEKVFLETLRKHPPSLFISRVCTRDHTFPAPKGSDRQLLVKSGTVVTIPIFAVHRDADYYPDPDMFDPERFADEAKNARPKCSFLGFGEGPRICIGQRFATAQVKAGIASVVKNFKLRLNPKTCTPLEIDPQEFLLAPKGGIWLDLLPRQTQT